MKAKDKLWRPTEPPEIDLHLDEIPRLEMKLFCLSIAEMCKEYLKDLKHRAECEEWM